MPCPIVCVFDGCFGGPLESHGIRKGNRLIFLFFELALARPPLREVVVWGGNAYELVYVMYSSG